MNTIATYTGVWRFPLQESFEDCMGTLSIADTGIMRLEVIHSDALGMSLQRLDSYPLIGGRIDSDTPVTLGDVDLRGTHNFTKSSFLVEKALIGALVDSFDEPAFNTCVASYKYLRDWVKPKYINLSYDKEDPIIRLNFKDKDEIAKTTISPGVNTYIWNKVGYHAEMFDYTLFQNTTFNIEAEQGISANQYLEIVNKFSLFLSIALYKRQAPTHIIFKCKEKPNYEIYFYFRHKSSLEPGHTSLISYEDFKNSAETFLRKWFTSYDDISPIARYLIDDVCREDVCDIPDYLSIAQGLDGYYRRFLNPTCKANVAFNKVVREIREHFINVPVISKCRFWPEAFQAARNYHTHLLNEKSAAKYSQILSQTSLRTLNDKGIILLTCCVLDFFGLSNEEINSCILHSQFAHGRVNFLEHLQEKEALCEDEAYGLIYDYLATFGNYQGNESAYRSCCIANSYNIEIHHKDEKHENVGNITINGECLASFDKQELEKIVNELYSNVKNTIKNDETI